MSEYSVLLPPRFSYGGLIEEDKEQRLEEYLFQLSAAVEDSALRLSHLIPDLLTGDADDISIGNPLEGKGALWDYSAATFTVYGTIQATSGLLGGWTIISGYVYDLASGTPAASPTDGIVMASGNAGVICYEDGDKRMEVGYLAAGVYGLKVYDSGGGVLFEVSDTQQIFSGWAISPTALIGGSAGTTIGLLPGTGIHMGNAAFGSSPFRVTNAGVLTATSGTIGGWDLTSDTIESASDNIVLTDSTAEITVGAIGGTHIQIDGANVHIRSSDYVSGALGKGWQIDANWAEFQNIYARGILRSVVFEYETISAMGGTFLISHDADKLNGDMGPDDTSTALVTEGNVTFAVGDFLRMKDGTDDEWIEVATVTDASNYVVVRDKAGDYADGANPEWTKGTAVVNFGQNTDGGILMTASETNSPHLDVYTINATPWNAGITTRMRIGNINGFLGETNDLYGIAIGETDKYLKYDPTNGLRIKGIVTCEAGSTGVTVTFAQDAIPTSLHAGDLWIDTNDGNKLYRATGVGDDQITAGEWVLYQDDNKITTFYQSGVPTAIAAGDLWIDSDDNKLYRATSAGDDQIVAGEWILQDAGIATGWSHASDTTKIDGGDIYANTIVLQGLASETTDRMFDDSTKSDNIQNWIHASDATLIDGGDIYAKTVTVAKLGTDMFGIGQLLDNGNMEDWSGGVNVAPDSWTLIGSGAGVARSATHKVGTYSAALTRGGVDCYLKQSIHTEKGINYWKGKTVTFSCQVYSTVASSGALLIYDGVNYTGSSQVAGDSAWETLSKTVTIDANATEVTVWTRTFSTDTTNYFDGVMLVEGSYAMPYADKVYTYGHPSDYTKIDGGDIYTGTVTADKITAGTYVGGNFVVGAGGVIQSSDYVADTTGFKLAPATGLEINTGTIRVGAVDFKPVVQEVSFETGAEDHDTNQLIPYDDTIPQNTEGAEYMTLAITPKNATNKLRIDVVWVGSPADTKTLTVALFQDSTANALAAVGAVITGDWTQHITFTHYMTSGTTNATTFKVRAGTNGNTTVTFNGQVQARKLGGVMASSIVITEYER